MQRCHWGVKEDRGGRAAPQGGLETRKESRGRMGRWIWGRSRGAVGGTVQGNWGEEGAEWMG